MTTIKGVMRSYGATVRRAERSQQKHNREAAKRYKVQQKEQQILSDAQAEADYRNYVDSLKSIHKDHSAAINWTDIQNMDQPKRPVKTSKNEERVQSQIDNFKPSFFDKLFGLVEKKLNKLNNKLILAKGYDQSDFDKELSEFANDLSDYDKMQKMAYGVINKDEYAYKDVLEYFTPFDDLTELSKQLKFKLNPNYIEVDMEVMSYDIIPGFELSLTSTGKLSRKNMSTAKYNELFQEHICSSVIRVAKEVSIYFPVNYVLITLIINELDTATGHRVNNTKLSTLIPIKKMEDIAFDSINPIDCLKSFLHNMKFTRTNGFANVSRIDMANNLLSI